MSKDCSFILDVKEQITSSKGLFLLGPPAFIVIGGLAAMLLTAQVSIIYILSAILLIIAATVINLVPFVVLLVMHFRRIRDKSDLRNDSFYMAYGLAISVMLIAVLLLIRELSLGRPGSQLAGAGVFFLWKLTVPAMIIAYIPGWLIKYYAHRRQTLSSEVTTCSSICSHLSRYKAIYIVLAVLATIWMIIVPICMLLSIIGISSSPDIYLAAEFGSVKLVKCCLHLGADINVKSEDENGQTPLHVAALYGHKGVVELLIARGAMVDPKDNDGGTPLHKAGWGGETATATILIKHGADVDTQDNFGDTPLHRAVHRARKKTVKSLLAHGADVNIKNKGGQTALWEAVYWGYEDLVKLLIEHGAEVNGADNRGRTPLSVAIAEKYKDICKLLREHGAEQ